MRHRSAREDPIHSGLERAAAMINTHEALRMRTRMTGFVPDSLESQLLTPTFRTKFFTPAA